MYGIQTAWLYGILMTSFENDVKMYGIQTFWNHNITLFLFENDVKMYGIQTMKTTRNLRESVWEWCKNVWYSNITNGQMHLRLVWEWCKNVWYSNIDSAGKCNYAVWEWCKNVWYSNLHSDHLQPIEFENDVKMYGIQTVSLEQAIDQLVWEWCKNVWYSNLWVKKYFAQWNDKTRYFHGL